MQQLNDQGGKKILVLGASSQIGDYLLPQLLREGYEVHGFTRKRPATLNPRVRWTQIDIFDKPYPAEEYDAIIHLAYLPHLPVALSHCADSKRLTRVIAFGSTSMFTKEKSLDAKEQQTAAHLRAAEGEVAAWCKARGIAWTIFRPTLIYGRGRDKNVTTMANFIRRYRFFPLIGGAGGLREPVHAKDLADAVMLAFANPASYGKAYNLSGGELLSYRAMVVRIYQALGRRPLLFPIPLPVLKIALMIMKRFKSYRHLTLEMATRMQRNLCFGHDEASRDFNYQPMMFRPDLTDIEN